LGDGGLGFGASAAEFSGGVVERSALWARTEEIMTFTRRFAAFSMFAAAVFATGAHGADDDDDDDALPNTFISPCGQPFRAPRSAPYAVADWFKAADKNGDGKLDRTEFVADAAAFFKVLDLNSDGVLSHYEVAEYEQRVAPEIVGRRVKTSWNIPRLWLAQLDRPGPIDPGGDQPSDDDAKTPPLDVSGEGAAPYGLLGEPEPVLAADLDLSGVISRANFLKLADMHFTTLDQVEAGYLTLARLPKTPVQILLEKSRPRRRKS
jgi:hypothetical protein